jgi:hypothetical protein
MSGGRGRAWMRFWDKDFDRWEITWGRNFIFDSRWGPSLMWHDLSGVLGLWYIRGSLS